MARDDVAAGPVPVRWLVTGVVLGLGVAVAAAVGVRAWRQAQADEAHVRTIADAVCGDASVGRPVDEFVADAARHGAVTTAGGEVVVTFRLRDAVPVRCTAVVENGRVADTFYDYDDLAD
jgi:hypothetical protein